MTGIMKTCALAIFAGALANAATTTTTTLTVTSATVTIGTSYTVSGPATLSGIGSGTFNATVTLAANITGNFTITLSGGSSIIGTMTFPTTVLTTGSGTGSATVTGGSGSYAGATGSFPSLAGTGSLTSFTLSFTGTGTITTGGSGGTTPTPSVTAVQNNYSYILPGLPNYGIAPGSLFIIKGSNLSSQPLSSLQSSGAPGLPLTFNGTSVSVTVNGTTTQPPIYYTSPTQLGVVLPSSTPVGTGTITVTNGTQTSPTAPIQVVTSALGLDTLYGSGTGEGVVTDANGNVLVATKSASPGQTVILWGSGVGADTANTDRVYPEQQDNLTGIPMQVYVGGIPATILYRGRSQYPGVDQINVTIPTNVATGCDVSVAAVSGNVVSNSVTIPIASGGGTCTDPNFGVSGTSIQTLSGNSTVNFGYLAIAQSTAPGTGANSAPTTTQSALGIFESVSGSQFATTASSGYASLGSCVVNAPTTTANGTLPTINGLDAGTITVTGPSGTPTTLSTIPGYLGIYDASPLPSGFIPAAGGSFTFKGTGGQTVGSFNTSINFVNPLTWTNSGSLGTVSRAQGATVTWSGGASGTFVEILGSSSATVAGQFLNVSFICNALASAQQFTVPSYVLLALPAGSGSLTVENSTNPQAFTASGLNLAYQYAAVLVEINATYN